MVKSEATWSTLSDGHGFPPLEFTATLEQGREDVPTLLERAGERRTRKGLARDAGGDEPIGFESTLVDGEASALPQVWSPVRGAGTSYSETAVVPFVQPGPLGILAREGPSVVPRTHHFDALEEERQRLLREIHDGPAQVVSNIGLRLDYLAKLIERDPERVHSELKFLQEDITRASLEMRRFMYELVPPGLAQGDLRAAIEGHSERVAARFGLAVAVRFDVDPLLTRGQQTAIFRIVQEAIQNVIKHACATSATVRSFLDGSTFVVVIEDNGTGLDNLEERLLTGHHFGLYSMRARARQVGASLHVSNGIEHGVIVTVRLPLDDL